MKQPIFSRRFILLAKALLPTALTLLIFAGAMFLVFLPTLENSLLENKKQAIQDLTASVISRLAYLDSQVKAGKLDMDEARKRAREQVRFIRYGRKNKDYFWINDTRPVMIMHPYRSKLEGQNLLEYRDSSGNAPFVDMTREALQGGGFVRYIWQWKDQKDKEAPKLSYVRLFKPWDWVVGTGIYLDDLAADMKKIRTGVTMAFTLLLTLVALISGYVARQIYVSERRREKVQKQRERLMSALREGEERYRTIADFAYDWEVWLGPDKGVLYCSPSCERITGYAPESFFENPDLLRSIVAEQDREAWDNYLQMLPTREGLQFDFRLERKDGSRRWLGVVGRSVFGIGMKPLGLRFSFRDITERKNMEEQLRHQALHDPLTGLANRTLCLDRIRHAMERAKRREEYYYAVVFMDLDRFKVINDSLGHRFGDMVLMETGRRLSRHMRGLDTVARFGGDEFVFLLDELASPSQALRIVKRVRAAVAEKFCFEGHEVMTTASFGIVLSPTNYHRAEDLLQNANIAMHRAKEKGRNQFKVFTSRMLENAVEQLNLENDMRSALKDGEFHIEYQPILLMGTNSLIGFEALARWNHPTRGPIPPSEFIPMAEDSGMIMELGQWVLENALKTLATWRAQSERAKDLFMAVNLSTRQFAKAALHTDILATLEKTGVPADRLKLEVTESAVMENPESALRTLNILRENGVQFSIDDFGTGYSSLTQLQRLPVDTLKVDRSFISRLGEGDDQESTEIVKAVVAMARCLDLSVVAEGVETGKQLDSLSKLNCECVQGFLFHEPLHDSAAMDLIAEQESNPVPEDFRKRHFQRAKSSLKKAQSGTTKNSAPNIEITDPDVS
jgi:diguanylate cyclase (GGDEF)-like protein/PAS domain S-box-containing protein